MRFVFAHKGILRRYSLYTLGIVGLLFESRGLTNCQTWKFRNSLKKMFTLMKGPRKKPPGPLVSHLHGTCSPKTLSSAECHPWATCRVSATEDAEGNKTPSLASTGSHSRGRGRYTPKMSVQTIAQESQIVWKPRETARQGSKGFMSSDV